MNLIVPILYGAVVVGLLSPKITRGTMAWLMAWVLCVVLWYYIRH